MGMLELWDNFVRPKLFDLLDWSETPRPALVGGWGEVLFTHMKFSAFVRCKNFDRTF